MYTEFHIVNVADVISDLDKEYEMKFGIRIRLADCAVKIKTVTDEELCKIKYLLQNTDSRLIASVSDRNYAAVHNIGDLIVIRCHELVSELHDIDKIRSLVRSIDTSCFIPAKY